MDVAERTNLPAAAPAAQGLAPLITRVYTHQRAWSQLREHWDTLLGQSQDPTPWQSWTFQSLWWQHLAADRELCIVSVEQHGKVCALLPLQLRHERIAGVPVRALEPIGMPDDVHRPRLMLGRFRTDVCRAALARIWNLRPQWDLIRLDGRPAGDAEFDVLAQFATERSFTMRFAAYRPTRHVRLDRDVDAWLRSRSARLRKSLGLALRRLEGQGKVRVVTFTGEHLARGYDLMLEIQARTLKPGPHLLRRGAQATAQFHQALLPELARRERARVYVLFCADRPIAASLAIAAGGQCYAAHSVHDLSLADCAPDKLLERFELELLMREGAFASCEFCGTARANELCWADAAQDTCRLWVLRPSARTQLLDCLCFSVQPAVRVLKSSVEAQVRALAAAGRRQRVALPRRLRGKGGLAGRLGAALARHDGRHRRPEDKPQ